MAGNIKGLTIEFNGEDKGLTSVMKHLRTEANAFDKELRQIDKSLKLDPKNTTLIAQKMQVLTEAADKSDDRVKALKDALNQLKAQGIDETNAEYRELEREIQKAEAAQRKYNAELKAMKDASSSLGQFSQKMSDIGNKATKAGEALKGVSMAAAGLDVALAGLAYKSGNAADELNTLSQVTGISTAELQKYQAMAGLVDVSVEAIAKSQTKMKKSMLSASQGTKATSEAFQTLGVAVTDANGNLRGQDEVFAEVIEALGKLENETERDALSMQIFGKSATELNPLIEDNGETYKRVAEIFASNDLSIVDQETLDKANAFNDELDIIKATGQAALNTIGMQLAGYLQPALEKVSEIIQKVFSWLSKLDPEVLTAIGIIAGVVAGLAPLLIIVGKLAFAISSITGLMATAGITIGGLMTTMLPIVGIIAGIVAVGVLLYKNWDTIKEKAQQLKEKVLYYWEALKLGLKIIADTIKQILTNPFETAFNIIKTIVDKIKALFTNWNIQLPHINLPHFSISPPDWKIGDLLKGQLPKLGIEWYKNGAIFTQPTILRGVGDVAGGEAVLPLKKLWEEMDKRFSTQEVTVNVYATPSMDVVELANAVRREIIDIENRRKYAWL